MKSQFFFVLGAVLAFCTACSGSNKGNDTADSDNKIEAKAETTSVESESAAVEVDRGYIVSVGDMAPDFTLQTTEGKIFKLSDMRGKIVMLQFTASWCTVCRKEMPFIERDIWQKHKSNTNFCLMGVDRDEPLEKVQEFAKQTGITYPMTLDTGGDVFALYADRKAGITRNIIIDKSGKIVMLTRLYNEEEFADMCKKIDELLK